MHVVNKHMQVPRLQYSYQASRFGGAAAARRQQSEEEGDKQPKSSSSSSSSSLPESAEKVAAAALALRYQTDTCSQVYALVCVCERGENFIDMTWAK